MANNDYKTRFTNKNSVLIDTLLLRTDVSEFCKKMGITQADYFNARGINPTVLAKSLRAYYTFDKSINEKEYTKLLKAKEIPESFSDKNKIGRIKNYILETICKGIKKDPKKYIVDAIDDGKIEDICSSDEHDTSLDLSSIPTPNLTEIKLINTYVTDPILSELKLMNTYLERLCRVWEV